MQELPEHELIRDAAGLQALGERLASADAIAFDTESNSRFVYRERVCLIQLNADGHLALIDTLALEPGADALEPLRAVLEDPTRPVYLHGGEYDVACLKRDYAIALRGVIDTQQAASLLGCKQTGYGALVAEFLGIELPKDHSLYDWGQRPIDHEALHYALDDVIHLPQLAAQLVERIAAADLDEEFAIANAAVEGVDAHRTGFDPAGIYRIKGVGRIRQDQLALLAAVHAWRDEVARHRDEPPGRVINNEGLLQIARLGPTNYSSLKRVRIPGRILREHGDDLLRCVTEARAEPPEVPAPPARREPDPREKDRAQRLKRWRREEAERRGVTLQAVLPARALDHLVREPDSDLAEVPQLGSKRIGLYGERLKQLVR